MIYVPTLQAVRTSRQSLGFTWTESVGSASIRKKTGRLQIIIRKETPEPRWKRKKVKKAIKA